MPRAPDTSFGHRLRERRKGLGLTLTAVAARSGVSAAMLSEVERGRKSPTLRVASQIAEGLACALSDLLVGSEGEGIVIQPRRERRRLIDSATGIQRHVLAPRLLRHGVEVVWYVVPEGQASEEFPGHRRGVIAHATIVRGVLESTTPRGRHRLRAGDSVTYPSGVAHRFRNAGRGVCEFLLVVDASRAERGSRP
jgi:transcriptional regulator with XRE-family HTH domain